MVDPITVAAASMVAKKLLEQVMEATKIAISCNKRCKDLHVLLEELQPIVEHAICQITQSNVDNASKRPQSPVQRWLDEIEGTLKRAAVEVDNCIKQQSDLNPVPRYYTGTRIAEVTESVKKLLQQAGLVGLAVTLSEAQKCQKMMQEQQKMMQEQQKMMQEEQKKLDDLRATALRIEFATHTQKSLQGNYRSSAQWITSAIKSAFYNLWQNLSLRTSDTGASSSSSWPRELIVNEDAHEQTDFQQTPQSVFGLDNFTKRLQQSINSIGAEPRCVGVCGMGGVGKTLLAQFAYNSPEVRKHFKGGNLIWLTVSQTPNVKALYDSCCTQLGIEKMSFATLEEYRSRLYNEFFTRRVFLVLDDVWNNEVLGELNLAEGDGSVTLVTTRNPPVLVQARVKSEDEVQVGVLSKEDSWELFCVHAFPRGLSNISSEVKEVAELVAEECKGLPLALKVIGGSMVGKTTCQEWKSQLKCLQESRQLPGPEAEEALFGRLQLSYDNLDNDSPVSKDCFLSFAAFPEDCLVTMEMLIKVWKAQGLLDDPTKKCGDDPTLSAYYFVGLLIGRSLIEVVDTDTCKVHDVMRDLALHIIEGQSSRTCLYRPGKKLEEFPGEWIQSYERRPCEVRNLSLMQNDLTTLNDVTFSAPKLEVLLLAHNEKLEAMPKQFLKGIENLKLLDLSNCIKLKSLPREIGNLRHLTHLYLDVCEELESLPKEVGNLTRLIHLHLSHCYKIKKLPKSIRYLQSLQWLDLSACYGLEYLPSTMNDLRSLQYLNLHAVYMNALWSKPSRKLYRRGFTLDICKLTALTELHIFGEYNTPEDIPVDDREIEKLCNQLLKLASKLVKLNSFHIYNFHNLEWLPCAIESMVYLEEFSIYDCGTIRTLSSDITNFSKLRILKLDHMSHLEILPALNTLKMLSTLSIKECKSIKKLPNSFTSSGAFPSLKELDCKNSGLVEFLEVKEGAMPKLQILNLSDTNIESLPDTLINLRNLKVVHIPKARFDDLCEKFENTWLVSKFR